MFERAAKTGVEAVLLKSCCKNGAAGSRWDMVRANRQGTSGTSAPMSLRLNNHSLTTDKVLERIRGQVAALTGSARDQPFGLVRKARTKSLRSG